MQDGFPVSARGEGGRSRQRAEERKGKSGSGSRPACFMRGKRRPEVQGMLPLAFTFWKNVLVV